MTAPTYDLHIVRGKTFTQAFQYADDEMLYRPITGIPVQAPARITAAGHGVPPNWPVRIESTRAPAELNTPEGEWLVPSVVDSDTLEFDELNLTGAKPFRGPSVLVFPRPADIADWKARMQIRDRIGGEVLLSFSSDPADQADGTITVDVPGSAFVLELLHTITEAIAWTRAVYDLEAIRPDGSVIALIAPSKVTVGQEVTVWG